MTRTLADMTAGKWSVTRYEDGAWLVWDGDGHHRGTYPTWEEAMRYAHRDARTITVTLPADPDRHAPLRGIEMRSDAPNRIRFAEPDWDWSNMIGLEADHIEPFALALLAHARRLA